MKPCPVCADEALGLAVIYLDESRRMKGRKANMRFREALDELKHAEKHLSGYDLKEDMRQVRRIRKALFKKTITPSVGVSEITVFRSHHDVKPDSFFENPSTAKQKLASCIRQVREGQPVGCTPAKIKRRARVRGVVCVNPQAVCRAALKA